MIALAADHAGYPLKEEIKKHLLERGFDVKDFGTDSDKSVDYAVFAKTAGEAVASGECKLGIFCCGTGVGISMAANKVRGVRAANCADTFSARMTSSRVIGAGLALDMVDLFVDTPFSGEERHQRRIDQVMAIENEKFSK